MFINPYICKNSGVSGIMVFTRFWKTKTVIFTMFLRMAKVRSLGGPGGLMWQTGHSLLLAISGPPCLQLYSSAVWTLRASFPNIASAVAAHLEF